MTTPRAAFVTGGSSGIGLEVARLLGAKGHPLALFARDRARLEAARAELAAAFPALPIEVWPVDVGERLPCLAAVNDAVARLGPPGWAVANAGVTEPGLFLDQKLDIHELTLRTNYLGSLYFSHATAQAMAGAGGGRLIFVASGAAFFGITGYGTYTPSKFAVRGLAEVLRVELAPAGIVVTLAYPPDTDTPMLAAEEATKPAATKVITASGGVLTAERVARAIVEGAAKGRFAVTPGAQMKTLNALHSVLAPALRFWQGRVIRRTGG